MTGNMPAAEVDVDVDLVRRLLTSQHPDLAELPIELVTNGWDNVMFRLGDDLAVRVPRRASAVPLIEAEQQWLARFAPSLPVPVPAPVRSGVAGDGYPWPWSVVPWFEGRPFAPDPPDDLDRTARQLGEFVAASPMVRRDPRGDHERIVESPEGLNEDCYDDGWLVRVKLSDKSEVEKLMSAAAYQTFLDESED